MALKPAPAKTEISDTYPLPSNATARTGFGNLWEWATSLLGTTGSLIAMLSSSKLIDPMAIYNLSLVPTVSGNALTMTVKSADGLTALAADNVGIIAQRHITPSTGSMLTRNLTANISLIISSGSTLGHANATEGVIYWYLIDSAGTQELAASTKDFGYSGLVTTVAEGGAGAADSATVMYSNTARSNVPFRCIGRSFDAQTTAGTWTVAPTIVELCPFSTAVQPMPAGIGPLPYSGATIPFGFIDCNQAAVSRTTYSRLFAAIGTTWGVGDGSTTFGLPPTPGRVAIGDGTGSGLTARTLGQAAIGEENHALTIAELAAHNHTGSTIAINALGLNTVAGGSNTRVAGSDGVTGPANLTPTGSVTIASQGSGTAHNTMQPSLVTKMIISTGGQ